MKDKRNLSGRQSRSHPYYLYIPPPLRIDISHQQ